jgi:hypothetical protein
LCGGICARVFRPESTEPSGDHNFAQRCCSMSNRGLLCQIPTYAHRETLLIFSALSTCDPGDILEAVRRCKDANIRCSVVGLAAEIYICKLLCEQTGGNYSVATSEVSIMSFAPCDPLTFCSVYCVRHWCLMDFFIIHQSVVYSIA